MAVTGESNIVYMIISENISELYSIEMLLSALKLNILGYS